MTSSDTGAIVAVALIYTGFYNIQLNLRSVYLNEWNDLQNTNKKHNMFTE